MKKSRAKYSAQQVAIRKIPSISRRNLMRSLEAFSTTVGSSESTAGAVLFM
jgi:hypothetical protein